MEMNTPPWGAAHFTFTVDPYFHRMNNRILSSNMTATICFLSPVVITLKQRGLTDFSAPVTDVQLLLRCPRKQPKARSNGLVSFRPFVCLFVPHFSNVNAVMINLQCPYAASVRFGSSVRGPLHLLSKQH